MIIIIKHKTKPAAILHQRRIIRDDYMKLKQKHFDDIVAVPTVKCFVRHRGAIVCAVCLCVSEVWL